MTVRVRVFVSIAAAVLIALASVRAADVKVDLSKEQVGKPPTTFEPMVGTWVIAQDGPDKVVMVDGRPWVASKDNPTKLLIESARRLYGTSNEELMDNAKQFAYYPVAILKGVDNFANGSLSMKFKTVAGDSDRCSGMVFNVKPNGDWLAIRYNDTEHNIVLWEFHNGVRRSVKRGREGEWMLDRNAWHELKMTVDNADFKAWVERQARARIHARLRAHTRPRRRAAKRRALPRQQPRAASARLRQRRPLVQDRQHQSIQGLCVVPRRIGSGIRDN